MPTRPPDDDRDLRLARRLDADAEPDGTDGLHDALQATRPGASSVDPDVSARLWARVEGAIAPARPTRAADRAPLRLVGARARRWAVAAAVVLATGLGLWTVLAGPSVVGEAGAEVAVVALPDGSTVTLRPHSRLVRLERGARAYGLEGEALFAVARDASRSFTVEAGAGTVRVLGTRFVVSTWGGRSEVFVEEGRVEVVAGAEAVVLAAGEGARAASAGVTSLDAPTAAAFTDWLRGEAVFERTPARRVADEIAQHFAVGIVLPPDVARQSVSGVLDLGSPERALDGLGRVLGGRFVPEGGGAFRFERP